MLRMLAVGDSIWELLGIAFIVLVPTLPLTYFIWATIGRRRSRRREEIQSGRAASTPFALISLVGSLILFAALLVMLLVIAVRALAA